MIGVFTQRANKIGPVLLSCRSFYQKHSIAPVAHIVVELVRAVARAIKENRQTPLLNQGRLHANRDLVDRGMAGGHHGYRHAFEFKMACDKPVPQIHFLPWAPNISLSRRRTILLLKQESQSP